MSGGTNQYKCSVHKQIGQGTLQTAGRTVNWAYQSAVYAAEDKENKDSLMQELRRKKGNVGTHSVWVSGVGKVKDTDLGFTRMDPEQTKERG